MVKTNLFKFQRTPGAPSKSKNTVDTLARIYTQRHSSNWLFQELPAPLERAKIDKRNRSFFK